MNEPLARHEHENGRIEETLEFLKRMRSELRTLRKVRVWSNRLQIHDVNGDVFEVSDLGYPHADIITVLDTINAAYKRDLIHEPAQGEYKEFMAGRRYTWANDRVM